jgi:arginine N-succinyltransferase
VSLRSDATREQAGEFADEYAGKLGRRIIDVTEAIVRPVRDTDLDDIFALAEQATIGITTLPKNRGLLAARIRASAQAFAKIDGTLRGESYLFVLEDLARAKVIGTSGVVSNVGGFEPFYSYEIVKHRLRSEFLGVNKEIEALHLVKDHDGPCEIGSLFLSPEHRGSGRGRLLSLARFVFMAERPTFFAPVVIAEMRGQIDERGGSPFWEAVGRHFFDVDLAEADYQSAVNKRFIGELMPEHPIYIALLPPAAQAAIGVVHPKTKPAAELLRAEGFEFSGQVDIFEAGPTMRCKLADVRSVRESVTATVTETLAEEPASQPYIVGTSKHDFRACVTGIDCSSPGCVRIGVEAAAAIGVECGDRVRYVTLRPASGAASEPGRGDRSRSGGNE